MPNYFAALADSESEDQNVKLPSKRQMIRQNRLENERTRRKFRFVLREMHTLHQTKIIAGKKRDEQDFNGYLQYQLNIIDIKFRHQKCDKGCGYYCKDTINYYSSRLPKVDSWYNAPVGFTPPCPILITMKSITPRSTAGRPVNLSNSLQRILAPTFPHVKIWTLDEEVCVGGYCDSCAEYATFQTGLYVQNSVPVADRNDCENKMMKICSTLLRPWRLWGVELSLISVLCSTEERNLLAIGPDAERVTICFKLRFETHSPTPTPTPHQTYAHDRIDATGLSDVMRAAAVEIVRKTLIRACRKYVN